MKHTADNSFDQTFRNQLTEVSVAPSEQVWERIATSLNQKKSKKRSILPWLSIAASVLLVSAVSWWFYAVEPMAPASPMVQVKSVSPERVLQKKPLLALNNRLSNAAKKQQAPRSAIAVVSPLRPSVPTPTATLVADSPILPQEQTLPATELPASEQVVAPLATLPESVSVAAVPSATPRTKKRIRNLSDLVNFVVAKVDPREEKILETSSDEAILSLTSLNIGPLKIKQITANK